MFIYNRRVTDEYLLQNLNEHIHNFSSLIYLKLQLEHDINSSIQWNDQCNGLVRMHLKDIVFAGVLVHLWF